MDTLSFLVSLAERPTIADLQLSLANEPDFRVSETEDGWRLSVKGRLCGEEAPTTFFAGPEGRTDAFAVHLDLWAGPAKSRLCYYQLKGEIAALVGGPIIENDASPIRMSEWRSGEVVTLLIAPFRYGAPTKLIVLAAVKGRADMGAIAAEIGSST